MSAPDGVKYIVIGQIEVLLANAGHCGYNDLGVPNMAVIRREKREYSEFRKGKLFRKWVATEDVFVRCWEP